MHEFYRGCTKKISARFARVEKSCTPWPNVCGRPCHPCLLYETSCYCFILAYFMNTSCYCFILAYFMKTAVIVSPLLTSWKQLSLFYPCLLYATSCYCFIPAYFMKTAVIVSPLLTLWKLAVIVSPLLHASPLTLKTNIPTNINVCIICLLLDLQQYISTD